MQFSRRTTPILFAGLVLVFVLTAAIPFKTYAQDDIGPVLAQMLAEARYGQARALLSQTLGDRPDAALHLAHLEGVIAMRQGRMQEAIAVFRALLAIKPDFIPARVELAHALRLSGAYDAAFHHYELLAEGGVHPALRQMATGALNAMRAERPYGASVRFSVVPSSNFNKGSGQETFEAGDLVFSIDEASRAKSGVGIAFGTTAFNTFTLTDTNSITASVDADVTKYAEGAEADFAALEGSLAFTTRGDNLTFAVGPVAEHQWSNWEPYLARYGVRSQASVPLGPRDIVTASFEALAQDYAEADYRDGSRLTGTIALKHALSPAASISISAGGTLERTQRPHLDHNDFVVGMVLRNEWDGGLITSLFGSYEHHNYLGDYPGVGEPRNDHRISVGTTLSHRDLNIAGFMPQITYRYSRQISNVSFFDYDSHDVSLSLTQNF